VVVFVPVPVADDIHAGILLAAHFSLAFLELQQGLQQEQEQEQEQV
jgi:hypothetical protein